MGKDQNQCRPAAKKLSSYSIRKALNEIDQELYLQNLQKLALDKWAAVRGDQWMVRVAKPLHFVTERI